MKALTSVFNIVQKNFLFRLYQYYIKDSILIVKRSGFKELIRKKGKKFLYWIVGYYAIRDTLLYIVIPFCVAKGLL